MTAIAWDNEALCEMNCAALYLCKRGGSDLGERFISKVEAAVASARSMPELYRRVHGEARKVRVERFPYHVIYWHDAGADRICILAVAHASREPGYWRDRMP
jgi:toxin ParE1/3/4